MTGQLVPNQTNTLFWNPPNSSRHFAKINQRITILESFQEFIPRKTAGGSKVLFIYFFTLWVRMKTNCHGIIFSSLSQPAGPKTGTLPSCNTENIESSWVVSVYCDKRTPKMSHQTRVPQTKPGSANQAGKWLAQNGQITAPEAVGVISCSLAQCQGVAHSQWGGGAHGNPSMMKWKYA